MRWYRSTITLLTLLGGFVSIDAGHAQSRFGYGGGGYSRSGAGRYGGNPGGGYGAGNGMRPGIFVGSGSGSGYGYRGPGRGGFPFRFGPFGGWGRPAVVDEPPPRRYAPVLTRIPRPHRAAPVIAQALPRQRPRTAFHAPPRPAENPRLRQFAARPNFVVPLPSERRYRPDEILVLTKGTGADLRSTATALRLVPIGATHIALLDGDLKRYRLPPGATPGSTVEALKARSIAVAAEPNYNFALQGEQAPATHTIAVTREPKFDGDTDVPVQYAVATMRLTEAHALAEGTDVRIAVIDSGIDETNPEVAGMVVDRFDAVGGTFLAHAHGTAMGGAIVAHKDLVGIAPKARLIAIRAFSGGNSIAGGTSFDILRGLDFAALHGARIVSMSFAGPQDLLLKQALEEARRRGIVTIAAAGNGGPEAKPLYPAAEPGVIAVTATDAAGKLFALANRGAYIAVAAPGVQVMAPGLGGGMQFCSGTSIATAEVSGIAALLLERLKTAKPDDIVHLLSESAHPLAIKPEASGAGIVDAEKAVSAADSIAASRTPLIRERVDRESDP